MGSIAFALAAIALPGVAAAARPLVAPFEFSRSVIGINIRVRGAPLYVMLDTGVDPSAIDLVKARSLGLKIDMAGGGEASGDGNAAHVMAYPTWIDHLAIDGRPFGRVQALAVDMKTISGAYGRPVDGTLGHSFLAGKLVLIDYQARTVSIFDRAAQAAPIVARCRTAWRTPLKSFPGDTIPIVTLRIGETPLPVSLDTGSSGDIELYAKALDAPGVKGALAVVGATTETGARGEYATKVYRLSVPVRLGPFTLPAGQSVTLNTNPGSSDTRLANVGNQLLAHMKLKLLLDYRTDHITYLGGCR